MKRALALVLSLTAVSSGLAEEAWQRSLRAAQVSLERGDLGAAERNLNRSVRAIQRVGPEHREVFSELQVLGAVQAQEGRLEKGSRLVGRALELAEIAYGQGSPALEPFWSMLGTLELQRGEYPRSAELLDHSYRALMGNVSTENEAFREVLRNYAEALRRSGRERDLLLLQSHYGHEVDLGPLELPPTPPPPPPPPEPLRRPTRPPEPREPDPVPREPSQRKRRTLAQAAESEDPREAIRRRFTEGSTDLPELPDFPPVQPGGDMRKIRRNMMILNTLEYQLKTGLPAIQDHERWLRQKLRKHRGRRRYKRDVIQAAFKEAMNRGGQLAMLFQPSGLARKIWPDLTSEPEQAMARGLQGKVEEYDQAFENASATLKLLMQRLIPEGE